MTGYEPQPLPLDPIQEKPEFINFPDEPNVRIGDASPDHDSFLDKEIEDEVQKRVAAELAKYKSLTGDIGQTLVAPGDKTEAAIIDKPKRKYTKKKA